MGIENLAQQGISRGELVSREYGEFVKKYSKLDELTHAKCHNIVLGKLSTETKSKHPEQKLYHNLVLDAKFFMFISHSKGNESPENNPVLKARYAQEYLILKNIMVLAAIQSEVLDQMINRKLFQSHAKAKADITAKNVSGKIIRRVLIEGGGPIGQLTALKAYAIAGASVNMVSDRTSYDRMKDIGLDNGWIANLLFLLGSKAHELGIHQYKNNMDIGVPIGKLESALFT
ncbi:hypothetical protein Ddc_20056 [Ditylenchus destructor]|nr:hypothetical protein Ddc_20056 [Ditylenchus destructor]